MKDGDVMAEGKLKKEINNAVGNNKMEGHAVTVYEQNLIFQILKDSHGTPNEEDINRLLEDIITPKEKEKEEIHAHKK